MQVLVAEVVAAVVWPEVIDESLRGAWRQDPAIAGLAEKLSNLDQFTDAERRLIGDFAESIPATSRLQTLNQLADAIVTLSNRRRSKFIDGIKRYTRQQIVVAGQIEASLNQLAELEAQADPDQTRLRSDIEETLQWQKRIFDQREHNIRILCELPVELEERLSNILRELAQYLP